MHYALNLRQIAVLYKPSALEIVSGRERHDLIDKPLKVFRFACHHHRIFTVIAVVKRTYAYRVSGGDKLAVFSVIYDQSKFRVELFKHLFAVFFVHRQKYLAIGTGGKFITFSPHFALKLFKVVYFAVAYKIASVILKRLHSLRCQIHYRKPVKPEYTAACVNCPRVVRTSGYCSVKA